MDEKNTREEKLITAFNNGYFLAKHEPELAQQIANIKASSEYVLAMQKGREQFIADNEKGKLPSWLTGERKPMDSNEKNFL